MTRRFKRKKGLPTPGEKGGTLKLGTRSGRLSHFLFAGHETFPFRYTWLPLAVEVASTDPMIFDQESAVVRFGVGKNMVRSIRHWALVTGILERNVNALNRRAQKELTPTWLGRALFGRKGWDPYLEDPATLWILHWQLAGRIEAGPTSWVYLFNFCRRREFSKRELLQWLRTWIESQGVTPPADTTLKRDTDCLLRTYSIGRRDGRTPLEDSLDCPLAELGLVSRADDTGVFHVARGVAQTLPDVIFAYGVVQFLLSNRETEQTMSLDRLLLEPGSPGRVFCLTEQALISRLERLAEVTSGALRFDETAGLRQLLIDSLPDPQALLRQYYKNATREAVQEPSEFGARI